MKPYRTVTATTSDTDKQISDGMRERIAFASAAWRMSNSGSFTAGEYVTIPADLPVPVAKNVVTYARGDSATVTVNVIDIFT